MRRKKVFVSGCFDLLHSGHIRFLENAAAYGDLHVGIGTDKTVRELKGRQPVCHQEERKYCLQSLKHVKSCHVNQGSGIMDFVPDLLRIDPDYFIVNEDGNTLAKAELCRQLNIDYVVLRRDSHPDLPVRSTTNWQIRKTIPYRLDLAGGWLDQPSISRFMPGPVINICVEPTLEFNERCGMASSTRRRAIELWENGLPTGAPEHLAKILFSYENPPGTKTFSGSQDAIGIIFPGLNRLHYTGEFWPTKITSVNNEKILRWIEKHLYLIAVGPRKSTFNIKTQKKLTAENVKRLVAASDHCWKAIQSMHLDDFGRYMRKSFEAQVSLFPAMMTNDVQKAICQYRDDALGWKLSGAGGGGYLALVSRQCIPTAITITIRRSKSNGA